MSQNSGWKRQSGFVWSMMGSAIGFANILSFSAQCYKNGGGAFLIPFVLAVLVLGLPMLFLEGTIGHRMRLPIVSAFGSLAGRPGKIFGWLSIIAVATIGAFYIVLTGYSIAYAYFAGANSIPSDTATFFKTTFLRDSGSLANFGGFSIPIFLSMLLVCAFSWVVLVRNIRSGVERICSLFLPLLCVLITLFAVITALLPGAFEGFRLYLQPDFSKLSSPTLWRDVFGHVFFSFSLGLGIVTAYSRHTNDSMSIGRAMWYVALGDLLVSVIAGFAIFGCVGYLSHVSGAPFDQIVRSDSTFEMGFVIFPKILQAFPPFLSQAVGMTFFFCVFIAGITGVFSIMESVLGNIQVEFSHSRRKAATLTTLLMLTTASLFCFGNGQQVIGALAPMVMGNNMLLGGIAEIIVFMYLTKIIREDAIWYKGGKRNIPYFLTRYSAPLILAVIIMASISAEIRSGFGLGELVRWGWFALALALSGLLSLRRTPELAPTSPSP